MRLPRNRRLQCARPGARGTGQRLRTRVGTSTTPVGRGVQCWSNSKIEKLAKQEKISEIFVGTNPIHVKKPPREVAWFRLRSAYVLAVNTRHLTASLSAGIRSR